MILLLHPGRVRQQQQQQRHASKRFRSLPPHYFGHSSFRRGMMIRKRIRPLLLLWMMWIFVTFHTSVLPPTTAFFLSRLWNTCRSVPYQFQRCGFLNLSVLMHSGDANTDTCIETCVFFPRLRSGDTTNTPSLNCGSCTILENENTTQPGYNIYIDLINITGIGNGTYFVQARDRWQQVIRNDLLDIGLSGLTYRPSSSRCQPPNIIDDLYICALYTKIDGRGTILGSAGPIEIRLYDGLPIIGEMKFDINDIYHLQLKNNFQNVILHEMAHVLGTFSIFGLFLGRGGNECSECIKNLKEKITHTHSIIT